MSGGGWFVVGALAATAVVTRIMPANTNSCCARVAYGVRDKIADYAGPFDFLVKGTFDVLGLTKHLPGLLDTLGVPLDA